MATIYPNKRDGKAVSYKFKTLLGRDRNKKQIIRCTTWTPPDGLTPSKEAKAAERAADAWEQEVKAVFQEEQAQGTSNDVAYCDMIKHILLLLFTFGIWYLIWIYRATRYLNCVNGEPQQNPTTKTLLCMFIPFYSVYWFYKNAQRLDRLAASNGIDSDLTMLCLILSLFVGVIPPMLMQDKINKIVAGNCVVPVKSAAYHSAAPKTQLGIAEEIKTYKELLDSGVITQEEFTAKKKELLGL